MSDSVCVSILVEDSVAGRDVMGEHGLSFYVRAGHFRLLFDTGQSDLLVQNAQKLNIPLHRLQAVGLSHGHYDHTGGLNAVLKLSPQARLFYNPAILAGKYARNPDGTSRSMGTAPANLEALREPKRVVVETRQVTEVGEGIYVTGEIPRHVFFEDTGGSFFLDATCTQPDSLLDDQALFFDTRGGRDKSGS